MHPLDIAYWVLGGCLALVVLFALTVLVVSVVTKEGRRDWMHLRYARRFNVTRRQYRRKFPNYRHLGESFNRSQYRAWATVVINGSHASHTVKAKAIAAILGQED